MPYDGSHEAIDYAEIYPPIGIARVGNSTLGGNEGYFIGPEVPGVETAPPGGFKDASQKIKKQAVRFRVYAFKKDGTVLGELDDPEKYPLTWKVHVANKKAAWVKFRAKKYAGSEWGLRNQAVQGWPNGNIPPRNEDKYQHLNSRTELIVSGENEIVGANQPGRSLAGTFGGGNSGITSTAVNLGELRTDARGRLLVLAGDGNSISVGGLHDQDLDGYNNDRWVDNVCDGTVQVTVKYQPDHGEAINITVRNNATVITAPPRFASGTQAPTTLYDLIEDIYERPKYHPVNGYVGTVNYYRDIYPLFKRIYMLSWTSRSANQGHGPGKFDFDDSDLSEPGLEHLGRRHEVFGVIRHPVRKETGSQYMPQLSGDDGAANQATLTQLQYDRLVKWLKGEFTNERPSVHNSFDLIPLEEQPSALTRAALEWSIGSSLHPGIECYWIVQEEDMYKREKPGNPGNRFRFDNQSATPDVPPRVTPGDLTKGLALPWQSDFYGCKENWWPSVRPDKVVTKTHFEAKKDEFQGSPEELAKKLAQRREWHRGVFGGANVTSAMVQNWFKLGFVTKQPYGDAANNLPEILVETQRDTGLSA